MQSIGAIYSLRPLLRGAAELITKPHTLWLYGVATFRPTAFNSVPFSSVRRDIFDGPFRRRRVCTQYSRSAPIFYSFNTIELMCLDWTLAFSAGARVPILADRTAARFWLVIFAGSEGCSRCSDLHNDRLGFEERHDVP